jgi:hypothetical protein
MGEKRECAQKLPGSDLNETGSLEDSGVDGSTVLKWMLTKQGGRVDRDYLGHGTRDGLL